MGFYESVYGDDIDYLGEEMAYNARLGDENDVLKAEVAQLKEDIRKLKNYIKMVDDSTHSWHYENGAVITDVI